MERARVLRISAKNVKSIKEVEIDVDGRIHEIRGDTGQGKTAILDTIRAALNGLDPSMVRNGADAAEIELKLNTATIKRIVSNGGEETLMVTDADNKQVERAKDFLRTIYSPHTFNPLRWVKLSGGETLGRTERQREQVQTLLKALPDSITKQEVAKRLKVIHGEAHLEALGFVNLEEVDFEQSAYIVCTAFERACYEYRKDINTEKKAAENALELNAAPERPAPKASLDECKVEVERLMKGYYGAESLAKGRHALLERRDDLRMAIDEEGELFLRDQLETTREKRTEQRADSEAKIAQLEKDLVEERQRLGECDHAISRCESELRRLENHEARVADLRELEAELEGDAIPDLAAMKNGVEEAQEWCEARRLQDLHDDATKTFVRCEERSTVYSELVTFFRDTLPTERLEAADLPVAGLKIADGKITIRDVPLDQLGTSEQISVGVRIASALNPRSAFVLVDGAESLGREDRKQLHATALDLDLQLIMTFVDPDAKPSPGVTVMSEGKEVKKAEAVA